MKRNYAFRKGLNLHLAWGWGGGLIFTLGRLRRVSKNRKPFPDNINTGFRLYRQLLGRFYWREKP